MSAEAFSANGLLLEIFDICHFEPGTSLLVQLKEKQNQIILLEQKLEEYRKNCTCIGMQQAHNKNKEESKSNKQEEHSRNRSIGNEQALKPEEPPAKRLERPVIHHERSTSLSSITKNNKPQEKEKRKNTITTTTTTISKANDLNISPRVSPRSSVSSTSRVSQKGGVSTENNKRKESMSGGSQLKLKFTYPIIDGFIYRLKGTRGEIRFRFQLTNADKFDKVAYIDVFDCEAKKKCTV